MAFLQNILGRLVHGGETEDPDPPAHFANVVIFGEAGVGKSSLINLITGLGRAQTSPDVNPCTGHNHGYGVTIGHRAFKIWDTVGLDSGGWFRARLAAWNLKRFLSQMLERNKLGLLVYCVRASRATVTTLNHYETFYSKVCGEYAVPIVVVLTGCERLDDMDSWWEENGYRYSDLAFRGHACVTTLPDTPNDTALQRKRAYSRRVVHDLIYQHCLPLE